jgi:hypothetical protein
MMVTKKALELRFMQLLTLIKEEEEERIFQQNADNQSMKTHAKNNFNNPSKAELAKAHYFNLAQNIKSSKVAVLDFDLQGSFKL